MSKLDNLVKNQQVWWLFVTFVALFVLLGASNPVQSGQRLVTIDGSITEIVYALGEQHRLVGRDVTSNYPVEAQKLPSVGYMRQLSTEGVLSLQPDMVIVTSDAKPSKVLDQLQESKVQVFVVDNQPTIDGVIHKVVEVAKILGVEQKGDVLVAQIRQQVTQAQQSIQQTLAQQKQAIKAIFILGIRNGNLSVAGQGSRANALLNLLHVENPVEKQIHNYQSLSAEAAIKASPDLIIMIEQGVSMSGGKRAIFSNPILLQTQIAQHEKLLIMPNDALHFGPRIGEIMLQVSQQIAKQVKT